MQDLDLSNFLEDYVDKDIKTSGFYYWPKPRVATAVVASTTMTKWYLVGLSFVLFLLKMRKSYLVECNRIQLYLEASELKFMLDFNVVPTLSLLNEGISAYIFIVNNTEHLDHYC